LPNDRRRRTGATQERRRRRQERERRDKQRAQPYEPDENPFGSAALFALGLEVEDTLEPPAVLLVDLDEAASRLLGVLSRHFGALSRHLGAFRRRLEAFWRRLEAFSRHDEKPVQLQQEVQMRLAAALTLARGHRLSAIYDDFDVFVRTDYHPKPVDKLATLERFARDYAQTPGFLPHSGGTRARHLPNGFGAHGHRLLSLTSCWTP
jgi:hypothetical protein